MKALTGAAMAMMVAGLVGCNSTNTTSSSAGSATASAAASVGQALCKGTGFVAMPKKHVVM
jgi:hypothetical protein